MPVPEPPITVAASRHGGPQIGVDRVVIHDEEYPVSVHSAEDVANYFARPSTLYQAHYAVDADSVQHCVPENVIAFHAPPNGRSIGIEQDGYARFSPAEWALPGSQGTIRQAAKLTREICERWGIPLEWLSVADLKDGKRGITSHANVSLAFGISTHTDPGANYPIDQFMALVREGDGGKELLEMDYVTALRTLYLVNFAREPDRAGLVSWCKVLRDKVAEGMTPVAALCWVAEVFASLPANS